jgi:hypothetical protein
VGVLVLALVVGPAAAYDVGPVLSTDGTPVPDTNKQGVPPAPAPDDLGCWAATAANVLGASGWGVGVNAQARAASIYADFIANFKVNAADQYLKVAGDCPAAAQWWVNTIGLNSAKIGQGFDPTNKFINFSIKQMTLYEVDYNFLLNQLANGKYVGVKWSIPGADVGHGMTLVGGDYGPNGGGANPNAPLSVWHDSDRDGVNVNPPPQWLADQPHLNTWGPNSEWRLDYWDTTHVRDDDWWGDGYFTAGQGSPKPAGAVTNFDVHHFIGLGPLQHDATGDFYGTQVTTLTTGAKLGVYRSPTGNYNAEWASDGATLLVPNQAQASDYKVLYLSVDFRAAQDPATSDIAQIKVIDDTGVAATLTDTEWAADNGQVLLTYTFDRQPAWETVTFPIDPNTNTSHYKDLDAGGSIYGWNLATECVPEPATMGLLALGALAALARRRM